MSDIYQNPSEQETQTLPNFPRTQGFLAPSPSFPAGGAAAGPNPPFSPASSGFTPFAGQMNLTDDTAWVDQAGVTAGSFWPPWNSLTTNGDLCPGFNPDGILNLAITIPSASGPNVPPGPTWPGIEITESGLYCVYAQVVMTSDLPEDTTVQDQICLVTFQWRGNTLVALFDSDNQGSLSTTVGTLDAFTCHSRGVMNCEAGDKIFLRMDSQLDTTQYLDYFLAGFSFYGAYRVR